MDRREINLRTTNTTTAPTHAAAALSNHLDTISVYLCIAAHNDHRHGATIFHSLAQHNTATHTHVHSNTICDRRSLPPTQLALSHTGGVGARRGSTSSRPPFDCTDAARARALALSHCCCGAGDPCGQRSVLTVRWCGAAGVAAGATGAAADRSAVRRRRRTPRTTWYVQVQRAGTAADTLPPQREVAQWDALCTRHCVVTNSSYTTSIRLLEIRRNSFRAKQAKFSNGMLVKRTAVGNARAHT